ncbi:protein disulfide-isomerase-like protein of the testis isoform X2 [Mustela putorius furo]|uniref:Protein disulfide-isomerase-like protein of the testis isoform X2 n=1 Tax=Mustela putorius furo TaxID=9669 RepID=A0A8U0MQ18_MUSPF|nr:protein disulfide-isomerase-like protein of the testis isoform X2 [Mustela putorius furo]
MKLLWMSLLLVAFCISTVWGLPEEDIKEASINISQPMHIVEEGNLLVLTPAGLTQMLNQTRFLMVLFHNPSSKQSRNLAEELGQAVEIMGKGKNGLGFGKVDITVEKELQKEFDVKKAPELKLFFEGNRSEPISCKGVVESTALVVWLRRQIRQKAFLFNNTQQVVEFVNSRPLVIIGFFQDLEEEVAELFYDMIKDFPELTFGVISISNVIGRFHVTLDSVLVFKKGKIVKREELINDITNKHVLNQVIKGHLTDFVIEYNTEILFILVNADEPRNGHILKYFRITEVNIPCVQILNLSSDARYKMPSEEITYENLKKFGYSFLNRNAKKHQSSEDIPKYWDQGPVKQLVGKNFNVVVFDKERDVFVMFYAPWSDKCKALFPVLEELGRKYQNHSTVTIAKMDITANDIQLMYLDRYPFFRLFPINSQQAVLYTGEHTLRGFSDFLESQIKTRIEDEDEEELLSVEQSEVTEEEALAEEKKVPFIKEELPDQKLPELENVTVLLEPAGQKETAEEEEKVAKPKGPPKQEKKPKVKEEL